MQAGLAPFLAGLVVALLFFKLRLGGLAVLAGVCAAAWLMGMLEVSTDTPRERIVLLTLAAAVLGLVADLAFHAGRLTAYVLGAAFGGAALWTFSAAIMQKAPVPAFILGGGVVLFVAWTVAFTAALQANSVRGGAAALGLGLTRGYVTRMAIEATGSVTRVRNCSAGSETCRRCHILSRRGR